MYLTWGLPFDFRVSSRWSDLYKARLSVASVLSSLLQQQSAHTLLPELPVIFAGCFREYASVAIG